MYGQRPHLPVELVEENGTGGFANGAAPGWWGRGEGGGYMNVVAHHPQHTAAYHHEQPGFDPQTCINLKGFEFSDLDHALLGEDPAMRSHAARLHQLSAQSQHGHAVQGFHQDAPYHPQMGGVVHGDPMGKFPTYQRNDYHAQQIQGGERHQLYRNGNGADYSQFVGMHPNVAMKHHPRNAVYQGLADMPASVPGQFARTQESEASARTQPTDHWQHRNFPNQGMTTHPAPAQLQNNAGMDSFEKVAQTELQMRMLYAQQSAAAQQRSMLSPVQANTPSPAVQKQCAAGGWQPAPLVSRSSSLSSTHSNLSGTSGQCFSPCMQTPTPIPQSPCGPVPQSPCQAQHPPHRSPNLSSLRVVQEEGARWSCEQPTQVMQQTVPQQGPTDPPNPLLERQAWELQQQRTGSVVLNNTEREQCTAWSPNFPVSTEQQHNVLPNHMQGEENVFSSQDGLQVGYNPSLPKVEREVEIPRLQMASPPVPYQIDMSRLEAKDQNFQRQIHIVQNTPVEGGGYTYQQEQPVPESPSFRTRHSDQFYPGFNTQSGLSLPATSVSNTEVPKEVVHQDLVVPPSQEQRLSHPALPMVAENDTDGVDSKVAPNFLWPSDGVSKSEQVISNSSQVTTSIANNYRDAASDLPDLESTRPRTQNVLAALSTACHNLITNLQRSTYNLYETVGKEERAQGALEYGGLTWGSSEHISQDMWKGEVDEVSGLPSVGSNNDLRKVAPVCNHTDDSLSQTSCNGASLSASLENEAVPTRKRRSSEDDVPTKGKKLRSKGVDVAEEKQDGNFTTDILDQEKGDFNASFPIQDGIKSTDTTGSLNPASLQNTETSLHLTIVNGNVYPSSGPNLQPNPVVATQQAAEIQEETSDSSEAKVCERNMPYDREDSVTPAVATLCTQMGSSETCQSDSGFEKEYLAGQDDQSIPQLENSGLVEPDQEDRSAGESRPVVGEDRHPLEILQAQIRLQQQQFNLAPTERASSRPSSAPCTTDSKEALLEDTWYQPSSPGPGDTSRAPWEKNREKMIKIEELEPGSVDRRLLHKLNEQRRRDSLKSAIYCLKQAIPDCRDSSDQSQQNVLNKANNFILEMLEKQRNADQCREEVRNLRARNLALQQGISALQREYSHLSKHP
ncbi:uncharacterized protein LOC144875046 [Branchiostoma floridae x Branchiostoma japonicum]